MGKAVYRRWVLYVVAPALICGGLLLAARYMPVSSSDASRARSSHTTAVAMIPRPARAAVPATPRVAILDFTVDQSRYRSHVEAADFTAAVSAMLQPQSGVHWVERQQLQAAIGEMQLSPLMPMDAARSLRLGQWVKADMLITGRLVTAAQKPHVNLEVVELARGDVLASVSVDLPSLSRSGPLLAGDGDADIARCAEAAADLLDRSLVQLRATTGHPIIAPLFVQNISASPRLNFVEAQLLEKLRHTASGAGVRCLGFGDSAAAIAESELAIMGLSDGVPDAWQALADFYIWGTIEETSTDEAQLPFQSVPVTLTLWLWDCGSEPKAFHESGTVAELETLQRRLTQQVIEAIDRKPSGLISTSARDKLARDLRARADAAAALRQRLGGHEFSRTPHGRALSNYGLRLLELAVFLAPRDLSLRRHLLKSRYGSSGGLFAALAEVEDRHRVVQMFGLPEHYGEFVSSEYLNALSQAMNLVVRPDPRMGVPADTPLAERQRLAAYLVEKAAAFEPLYREAKASAKPGPGSFEDSALAELMRIIVEIRTDAQRLASAIDRWWPHYQPIYARNARWAVDAPSRSSGGAPDPSQWEDRLLAVYTAAGQPERVTDMLWLNEQEAPGAARAPFTAAGTLLDRHRDWYEAGKRGTLPDAELLKAAESRSPAPKPSGRPIMPRAPGARPLPHAAILAAPRGGDAQAPTELEALHRIPSLRGTLIGHDARHVLHEGDYLHLRHIRAIHFAHGRVWIAAKRNPRTDFGRWLPVLMCFDPTAQSFVDVTSRAGEHAEVTAIADDGEAMWLATAGEGALRIAHDDLATARLGSEQGLITPRLASVVAAGERVYFSGDAAKLSVHDAGSGRFSDLDPGGTAVHRGGVTRPLGTLNDRPMVAAGPWLMYGGSMANIYNVRTRENVSLAAELERLFGPRDTAGSSWTVQNYIGDSDSACFWMVSGGDLVRYDPGARAAQRWPVPLPSATRVLLADGLFVWLVVTQEIKALNHLPQSEDHLLLWHAPSQKFVGRRQIAGKVTAATTSGRHLWLACEPVSPHEPIWGERPVLWSLNKAAAYVRVDPQWRPTSTSRDAFNVEGLWEPSGSTPLMRAAWDADPQRVSDLLAGGADPEAVSKADFRALMPAVIAGDVKVVEQLLGRDAWTLRQYWRGPQMVFAAAVMHGQADLARWMLERYPQIAPDRPMLAFSTFLGGGHAWSNHPPLLSAAEGGLTDIVQMLLNRGVTVDIQADVDVKTPVRVTPLLLAARNGHEDVVRLLLERGADHQYQASSGKTAAALALESGYADVVAALTRTKVDAASLGPLLADAVKQRNHSAIASLLEQGANPDAPADLTGTVLSLAVRNGDPDAVQMLLEAGADPHKVTTWPIYPGKGPWLSSTAWAEAITGGNDQIKSMMHPHTPDLNSMIDGVRLGDRLLRSSLYRSPKLAAWLIGRGCDLNVCIEPDGTPLMLLTQMNNIATAQMLLDLGADPLLRRADGKSPLDLATSSEMRAVLERVLAQRPAGSRPGRPSPWLANHLLAQAVRDGDLAACRTWLGYGADPLRHDRGNPLLTIAAAHGHLQTLELLLDRQAPVNAGDAAGFTALMRAAAAGHTQIVERLLRSGADPRLRNGVTRLTAADLAEQAGHHAVAEVLRRASAR